MCAVASDIGVEQPDREDATGLGWAELQGEVVGNFARRVAHALNGGHDFTVLFDVLPFGCSAEDMNALGPCDRRLPAVEGIVIAVNHERLNSLVGEAGKSVSEPELRPYGTVCAIVDIARDDEEIDI
jgi:hypothetical protein